MREERGFKNGHCLKTRNTIRIKELFFARSLDRGGEKEGEIDEEDPYAWLSKTAPPSPG